MIPRSWTVIHSYLTRLAKIPRFALEHETFWYQSTLTRVIILLCGLIWRIETGAQKTVADGLVRDSILIIVIAIINLGGLKPLPSGYHRMWDDAQKVNNSPRPCGNHHARNILTISTNRCFISEVYNRMPKLSRTSHRTGFCRF